MRAIPLSDFNVLNTTDPDVALESIRIRQPGSRTIDPVNTADWALVSNALQLGPVTLVTTRSGGYSIALARDDCIRLLVPLFGTLGMGANRDDLVEHGGTDGFLTISSGVVRFRPASGIILVTADRARVADAMRLYDCEIDPAAVASRYWGETRLPGLAEFSRRLLGDIGEIDETPQRMVAQERYRQARGEILLLRLADLMSRASAPERDVQGPKSRVLRRALDYIDRTDPTAFSYADLALHAGASLRTVQLAFRRELDTTVGARVRRRQLAFARSLMEAADARLTVTEVAELSGFGHAGRFAAIYRAAYGESPSRTLRRLRR